MHEFACGWEMAWVAGGDMQKTVRLSLFIPPIFLKQPFSFEH